MVVMVLKQHHQRGGGTIGIVMRLLTNSANYVYVYIL